LTESAVTGVGEELLRARQACGLEITDVAQQLKFAPRQLEALEQERFDLLPGATIARGMLRNYARLLKLDPEPLIQRMADRLDAPDSNRLAERFSQPVNRAEPRQDQSPLDLAERGCADPRLVRQVVERDHPRLAQLPQLSH